MKTKLQVLSIFLTLLITTCSSYNEDEAKLTLNLGDNPGSYTSGYFATSSNWPPQGYGMLEQLDYEILLSGSRGAIPLKAKGGGTISVTVPIGLWNVKVDAYYQGDLYARGENTVDAKAGQVNSVTIKMNRAFMNIDQEIDVPGTYTLRADARFVLQGQEPGNPEFVVTKINITELVLVGGGGGGGGGGGSYTTQTGRGGGGGGSGCETIQNNIELAPQNTISIIVGAGGAGGPSRVGGGSGGGGGGASRFMVNSISLYVAGGGGGGGGGAYRGEGGYGGGNGEEGGTGGAGGVRISNTSGYCGDAGGGKFSGSNTGSARDGGGGGGYLSAGSGGVGGFGHGINNGSNGGYGAEGTSGLIGEGGSGYGGGGGGGAGTVGGSTSVGGYGGAGGDGYVKIEATIHLLP